MNLRTKLFYILCIIFFSSCADALSGNSPKEQKLFNQIKIGMTVNEVDSILGKPDWIQIDSISSKYTMYRYYFTESKSGMRSTLPTVVFDSTGRVNFSTYGDGG